MNIRLQREEKHIPIHFCYVNGLETKTAHNRKEKRKGLCFFMHKMPLLYMRLSHK